MRAAAAGLAEAAFADHVALRCAAAETVRDRRIRDRIAAGPAIADAALLICRRVATEFELWPEASVIDTSQPIWRSVATAMRAIGTQGSSAPRPPTQISGIH
jgi:predicted kinase